LAADPHRRSYVCPFCDSTYVIDFQPEVSGRQEPEFVVGFAVTPSEAAERFREWLRAGGWFRPGDLRQAQVEEKLVGVYLPFWAFSMLARSRWSASIGEYWYRTETYTTVVNGKRVTRTRRVRETEWWDLRGRHHQYHSGYLISASRGLPSEQARQIEPFQLPALKRYHPSFLAGWQCEEFSVPRDQALEECQAEFARRQLTGIQGFLPGDTHSDLQVQTDFEDVHSDLILLPVYLASYRYRERVYRFLLNGQTGKAAGDKPLSWRRIATAAGLALLLVAAVVLVVALANR
jgi:hypothetical protein